MVFLPNITTNHNHATTYNNILRYNMDEHPLRPENNVRSKERSLPKGGSSLFSISVSSDSSMGLCWGCLSLLSLAITELCRKRS